MVCAKVWHSDTEENLTTAYIVLAELFVNAVKVCKIKSASHFTVSGARVPGTPFVVIFLPGLLLRLKEDPQQTHPCP